MQLTRVLAAAPLACLLLILGCSKTEDVAPERQLFGDPPKILNFRILNPDLTEATSPQLTPADVECDFSRIMETRFCSFGFPGLQATPPIVIRGTYTQVIFEAVVDDPDSVRDDQKQITQSNILLVASSFVLPSSTNETTLVLFNDGSANKFPQAQKVSGVGEDCTIDEFGNCFCQGAIYLVDSNDPNKEVLGDEIFTRAFAFVNQNSSLYLQDCIMRANRQVPFPAPVGSSFRFRIDAVDRQGNLHTWPKSVEVVSGQDSFSCTGDLCGCCFLESTDPVSECRGLSGMTDNQGFEFCKHAI